MPVLLTTRPATAKLQSMENVTEQPKQGQTQTVSFGLLSARRRDVESTRMPVRFLSHFVF